MLLDKKINFNYNLKDKVSKDNSGIGLIKHLYAYIRKGTTWSACNKMEKIWKYNLERDFKIRIFRATIEPVLLYRSESWTLSTKQQHRLDGCYTRLLRRVQNLSWNNHPTLETIYGNLPGISSILMKRRVQFVEHCSRASNELVSSFVLWSLPSSHKRSRKLTFLDTICRETSIATEDLFVAMSDRTY